MIAAFVGDDDGTPIGEPARRKVRAVLCVAGDLASLAVARVDDEKVLGRVIEHPHHEEPRTVRRPATDDMPERTRHKWPFSPRREIGDHDVHIGGRSGVARESDQGAIRGRRVPRQKSLDATGRIRREVQRRTVGVPHVQLMQLRAPAVRRGDELAVRTPAEASDGGALDGDRALRFPARGGQRPRFVGACPLIRDDRERFAVGRDRERGPACEATGGVRDARQALARMEVREGTLRHGPAMLVRSEDVLDTRAEECGDAKRKRETGIVLLVLERVHGLTRYVEPVGELALRPVAFSPQHTKAILHR